MRDRKRERKREREKWRDRGRGEIMCGYIAATPVLGRRGF